jgi:hypothetical protein
LGPEQWKYTPSQNERKRRERHPRLPSDCPSAKAERQEGKVMLRNKVKVMDRATFKARATEICEAFYEISELASEIDCFLRVRALDLNAEILQEESRQKIQALATKRNHLAGLASHWGELAGMLDNASTAFFEGSEKDGKPEYPLNQLVEEFVRWPGMYSYPGLSSVQTLPDTFISKTAFNAEPLCFEEAEEQNKDTQSENKTDVLIAV